MKKVVDENGVLVNGLYRDETGALVVKDEDGFDKYNKRKALFYSQRAKIEQLTSDVEELKSMVAALIQHKRD